MNHACCWGRGLVPCQERAPEGDRREIWNNLQIHKKTPLLLSGGLSAGAGECLLQVPPALVCSPGIDPCASSRRRPVVHWDEDGLRVKEHVGFVRGMGLLPPQDLGSC